MGPTNRIDLAFTPPRAARSFCACGFTLVEMLTVLSVLSVVVGIAAPGLRSFAAGQKLKALSYDMTTDLLLARSEALKRNASVSMAASGPTWASGWTLVAAGENISTRAAANESLTFTGTSAVPVVPTSIIFDVNGRATTVPASAGGVRMTISSSAVSGANAKRCIQLDVSGRARSLVGACT